MPTECVSIELVETPTGTYEIHEMVTRRHVVWSPRAVCPVGSYDSLPGAVRSLNYIRMGDALPDQDSEYHSLDDIVQTAESLSTHWEDVSDLELPVSRRLLLAIRRACEGDEEFVREEILLLADLAGEAVKLETNP